MQSTSFSISSRIWLDQLRQATPGPFARFRDELTRILEADLMAVARRPAKPSDDRSDDLSGDLGTLGGLLRAFEAGYRDDPLAAEEALRELVGRPPPDSLLASLFSACTAVRMATGLRRCDHRHGRTLAHIH